MDLINALTVDAAPSATSLFRFALITALEGLKKLILLYPLNLIIFALGCIFILNRLVRKILPKPKFEATYAPLKHNENSPE
jgi:hypothetical protein